MCITSTFEVPFAIIQSLRIQIHDLQHVKEKRDMASLNTQHRICVCTLSRLPNQVPDVEPSKSGMTKRRRPLSPRFCHVHGHIADELAMHLPTCLRGAIGQRVRLLIERLLVRSQPRTLSFCSKVFTLSCTFILTDSQACHIKINRSNEIQYSNTFWWRDSIDSISSSLCTRSHAHWVGPCQILFHRPDYLLHIDAVFVAESNQVVYTIIRLRIFR